MVLFFIEVIAVVAGEGTLHATVQAITVRRNGLDIISESELHTTVHLHTTVSRRDRQSKRFRLYLPSHLTPFLFDF